MRHKAKLRPMGRYSLTIALMAAVLVAGCSVRGGAEQAESTSSTATSSVVTVGTLDAPDGLRRTYRLLVPPNVGATPALVIGLHGGFGSGEQFEQTSQLDRLALRDGFIAVYPDGTGAVRTWNAGSCCGSAARNNVDDVGFISALIRELEQRYEIDPHRVYAMGHSNGGMLAYRLACELSNLVVGVGVQSATQGTTACSPEQPVSLMHVHGTFDKNLPFAGGVGPNSTTRVAYEPAGPVVESFAQANDCPASPVTVVDRVNPDVHSRTWQPCAAGSAVRLVLVDGASHAWMGTPAGSPRLTGEAYLDYDTTVRLWEFLSAHPRI